MRKYGVVSPLFWTGRTGRALRKLPTAQRIALYLLTCPNSNMIGLYYLPLPTLQHELNLTKQGACKGLIELKDLDFVSYDMESEIVFVHNMVVWQVGKSLKPKDKRVLGIDKELVQYRNSQFYNDFLERHRDKYHLESEVSEGACKGHHTGTGAGTGAEAKPEQEYSEHFESFWLEYPTHRRGDKKSCNVLWRELKLDSKIDTVLVSLKKYKMSDDWVKDSGKYVKGSKRWLREDRETEPQQQQPPPPQGKQKMQSAKLL